MPQRILVVDDDANALRLISYALHREGFEVLVASSGPDALQVVEEQVVDLVVLDIMMPQMDGFEVCRRMRENPKTSRLPVIMLTAKSQSEDKIRGFQAGADDYITKPALPAELVARIRALLARSTHVPSATVAPKKCTTIAFLGAQGGVGTTTLAVNAAIALAQAGKSAILADLHLSAGAVAWQLGLEVPSGLLAQWKGKDSKQAGRNAADWLVLHNSGLRGEC